MEKITNISGDINNTLEKRRGTIQELGEIYRLLKGRQFLFDLPARLKRDIEFEAYDDAVKYFTMTHHVFETYKHLPSFSSIYEECEQTMAIVKQKLYNPRTGIDSLEVVPISQSAAKQRAGRAGRTQRGKCYRLYTTRVFEEFALETVPEIQRTNLDNTVLALKAIGIPDILAFDFLDRPSDRRLIDAMKRLYFLGALDEKASISNLGQRMVEFPLDPCLSRMLLASVEYGCSDEMLTILAMLSVENIIFQPGDRKKKEDFEDKRRLFAVGEARKRGDLFVLLNIYELWLRSGKSREWCKEYYIQSRLMYDVDEHRKQLSEILDEITPDMENKSKFATPDLAEDLIRALCQGLFMNTSRRIHQSGNEGGYLALKKGMQLVHPHPSSVLFDCKTHHEYVLFHSLLTTTRPYMQNACIINFEYVKTLLMRMDDLDVRRLINRDQLPDDELEILEEKRREEKRPNPDTPVEDPPEKFERRNNEISVEAARRRYLERKKKK